MSPTEGEISYNGLSAPYYNLGVDEQILYSEDRTSQIGAAFTFKVTGFVVAETRTALQEKIINMRIAWEAPRGTFYVKSGGQYLWAFSPATGGSFNKCEDWGPLPGTLTFGRFAAGLACTYSFSVTCTSKSCLACSGENCAADDILSVAQSWTHQVDQVGLTTRTCNTLIRLRARTDTFSPDSYRLFGVPECPSWFERVSQQFTQSEDGLTLSMTVVDNEKQWMLPQPITKGGANLRSHIEFGGMVTYHLSGSFSAPPSVSKGTILRRINDLMLYKIPNLNAAGPSGVPLVFIQQFDFTDHLFENTIEFTIMARGSSAWTKTNMLSSMATVFQNMTTPPTSTNVPGDPTYGRAAIANPYGNIGQFNSGLIAPLHTIYDACDSAGFPYGGFPLSTIPPSVVQEGVERSTGTASSITQSTVSGFSEGHIRAPYLAYHEQISYELDTGIVSFMPKKWGAAPVFQQSRAPKLMMIQAGYATRIADRRDTTATLPRPAPLILGKVSHVMNSYIAPASEEVIDEFTSKWTIHWRYVSQIDTPLTSSNDIDGAGTHMIYPLNPIREDDALSGGTWPHIGISTYDELVPSVGST